MRITSLIVGIVFVIGGFVAAIPSMMMVPFPYGLIIPMVIILIGLILVKKYKKKSRQF